MPQVIAHDHHFDPSPGLRWLVRGLVLALMAGAGLWFHAHVVPIGHGPAVQRVKLMAPDATPPPTPQPTPEPQDQKPDKLDADSTQILDSAAPSAPGQPGPLGVDSEGDAGADSFALAAHPGGRELTTYPEGSGYGLGRGGSGDGVGTGAAGKLNTAFLGLYMRRIGYRLEGLLAHHDELRRQSWRATVAITIDAHGIIRQAQVLDAGGDGPLSGRLNSALVGMDTGEEPPHAGDTLRILIRSRLE
ncbi:hypothetical protein Y88_2811 [Novosphingobium nitrogenifigens DSM 19370]|uniref:Uncharacterized protein n=1 Tax=Novosphingobium nitrogenifigens DSM 19370 TaxID=983920 RepID=F1Z4B1_9SPHN|nr:hypothetical protein [Novosphingobium nitrogenifigens]EGD60521.1 hypothetical protein Y88_2811 [Novosphingobium nitrogenifigens DSM 19370]